MSAQVMTTEQIKANRDGAARNTVVGMLDRESFDLSLRIGKMLSDSPIVPENYKGNLPNCVIALNMANRIGADVLMVMQNLVPIYGRPSWSSKFLIATFNSCGRFSSIRYEFFGEQGTDSWGCRAWAVERETGNRVTGPDITIALAKSEGWYEKKGSKWKSIPQLMLQYRSAAWLVNTTAPELAMGLSTQEESFDTHMIDVTPPADQTVEKVVTKAAGKKSEKVAETVVDEVKTVEEKAQMIPTASINNVIAEFDAAQTQDDLETLYNTRVMPHYSSIRTEDHDRLNQAHEKNTARLSQQQEPAAHQQSDVDDPFGNME